ncbi:family 16 glycosylhydrolase [Pelagicoccus sp. SDUM812003]|uniref:family 16 glycosylhydrolase n=1 Tax=Pelagicoccus sp. SDUM812003 TaxID=3041267 RepID=UPI00280F5C27|nr:family 16 glycosylhydrolase [Pelagicoccus sp. SDUM812003]MDQ8201766.1 family 16 glycosylhydrolase [Pelagicoccus sp. SDUM812003]
MSRYPFSPPRTRLPALALLTLLTLPAALSLGHGALAEDWLLVWSDEFETEGLPNAQWWDWEEGYIRNDEAQYYTRKRSENARIENGHLIIEARKGDLPGHDYSSASLTSRRSASWTYGRVEVRAKVPAGTGTWPAIWMLGDNIGEVGWPACGEIDIMEYVGYLPGVIHGTVHTTAYNHAINTSRGDTVERDDLESAMRVYAVEWDESKIDFFVDDQKYFTFYNDERSDDATWPFHRPQHLKLNLAIGGTWGGQQGIDESIFPCQFLVDYVRVYQRAQPGPYSILLQSTGPGLTSISPQKDSYQAGERVTLSADPDVGMRFFKWKNLQVERGLRATIEVNRDLDLTAQFVDPSALNLNTDFSNGLENWYSWVSEAAAANVSVEDGAARIHITQAGPNIWEAQFGQGGISLQSGDRYQLSFDAWSEVDGHEMKATLTMNAEPFQAYAERSINLTTEPQTYLLEHVHSLATDANSRIEFDLSSGNGSVRLDNVRLVNLDLNPLGPYESWKQEHGIRPADDAADSDQDGRPTIVEYFLASDPHSKDPKVPLARIAGHGSALRIAPVLSPRSEEELSDVTVSVYQSQSLEAWTPSSSDQLTDEQSSPRFARLLFEAVPPIQD